MSMTEKKLRSIQLDATVNMIVDFQSIIENLISHVDLIRGEHSSLGLIEAELHKWKLTKEFEETLLNLLSIQTLLADTKKISN